MMNKNRNFYSKILLKLNTRFNFNFMLFIVVINICFFIAQTNMKEVSIKPIINTLLVISIIALICIFIIYNTTMKCLNEVMNSAKDMAEGKLNKNDIVIWANKDIRILAQSFNKMKANLLLFFDNTKINVLTLFNSIESVSKNMESSYLGNEHVHKTIEEISVTSKNQLSQIEGTDVKIKNIYESISNILEHLKEVERMAINTSKASTVGTENLNAYDESLKLIFNSIKDTEEFISKLNLSANEISDIVIFIVSLSEQLKLLSLNASIEAARAGESGKSFSVVANEITKMAQATKESIGRINCVLQNMLDNSKNVDKSIKVSIKNFERGNNIFLSMKGIFDEIKEKNILVFNEINRTVNEAVIIDQSAKETSDLSRKVFDSSVGISQDTEKISEIIQQELSEFQEINSNVVSLQSLLNKIENILKYFDFDIKPVKKNNKSINIAVLSINPNFGHIWSLMYSGVLYAKKVLSNCNANIDFIEIPQEKLSPEAFPEFLEEITKRGYEGISFLGFFQEAAQVVNKQTDKGIAFITFNSDINCKRISFVGQDAYKSGEVAAETMENYINGKGSVLIVSTKMEIGEIERRTKGFIDTISQKKQITIEKMIIQNPFDTHTIEKELDVYLSKNNYYDGILLVSIGQTELVKVLESKGLEKKVKVIVYDTTEEVVKNIRRGLVTCAIGQDPFRQGYDPVIYLYNYLVAGEKPPYDKIRTRIEIFDKESVENLAI